MAQSDTFDVIIHTSAESYALPSGDMGIAVDSYQKGKRLITVLWYENAKGDRQAWDRMLEADRRIVEFYIVSAPYDYTGKV